MAEKGLWYKEAVFYELNVKAFYDTNGDGWGDFNGVTQKLDHLEDLGVTCIWLLPVYPSPRKDDGYDISEYKQVDERYGSLDDFQAMINAAHARGIRVIMDLVLNHTSDQHAWFQASRAGDPAYSDYYVWSDTDQKYTDARIIFLDTEPSNWTWDEQRGAYYWHRFYASQPDLNFENPRVRDEMLSVAKFWLGFGIDGFRADAVPYLFEEEGTNCENLPRTHDYLKDLRAELEKDFPEAILLCEANQWPEDVRPYFGDGDEFHMGFHFPIMPRIFMGLKKGDISDVKEILARTPEIPENTQWCMFLRNHDELTLEMVTEDERQWMWKEYAPEPRMKLNLGIRRRLAPLLNGDANRIMLANSILMTMPGTPIIYYGDEIGMGDRIELFDRDGVRTPMQWLPEPKAGFTTAEPYAPFLEGEYAPEHCNLSDSKAKANSIYRRTQQMVATRQRLGVFGSGSFEWVDAGNNAVAAYIRAKGNTKVLVLQNMSASASDVRLFARGIARDAFGGGMVDLAGLDQLLGSQTLWLELE